MSFSDTIYIIILVLTTHQVVSRCPLYHHSSHQGYNIPDHSSNSQSESAQCSLHQCSRRCAQHGGRNLQGGGRVQNESLHITLLLNWICS